MPSGEIQVVVMVKNNIYPREIQVYSEFLAEADKLMVAANDSTKFAPKCLHTSHDPKEYLIFEDLKERGYKVLPRDRTLNLDQALAIIVKLAKLHATSAVLYEQKPSTMDLYLEGSISSNPERQGFLVHFRNCARTLGLVAKTEWGSEWKGIAEKLDKLQHTIVQKGCNIYLRDDKSFNVFNHNDLWIPNFLFKTDDNDVIEDVLFVDFQLSCFNSPGIDLNFFFYGSLAEEVRVEYKMKLIKVYYENLSETLGKLGYKKPIPTLHEIHLEILKNGFNGVIAAVCIVPLLIVEQSDDLQMDTLLGQSVEAEAFRYRLFNNPKYKPFIQKLLTEFDDFGYLD